MSNKPIVLILLHNDSVEANKIAAQVCQQLNQAQVSICALASDKKLVQTLGFEIDEFIEGKSANPNLARARLSAAGIPIPSELVTAWDVENGKPHPEPYLKGAANLGFDISDCVVFEDAASGILAGL